MVAKFPSERIQANVNAILADVSRLNLSQSLEFCTRVSQYQFAHNKPYEENEDSLITSWFTAYLAKEILLNASEKGAQDLDLAKYKELSRMYAVADVGYLEARTIPDNIEKLRRQITIHFIRRLWVEPIKTVMSRVYFTLYEAPFPEYERYRLRWNTEFRRLYGIDFPDFFRAAMGVFVSLQRRTRFDRKFLQNTKVPEFKTWFTNAMLDPIVENFCCSVRDFRTRQQSLRRPASPIQSLFEFNYLKRRPLIEIDSGAIIAPCPVMIADRISTGIHYDIIESLKSQNLEFRDFTTDYGKLFEGYVGRLLAEFYTLGTQLFAADTFFSKKQANQAVCDWIILEDNAVILIECKGAKVPLSVLEDADVVAFRKFFIDRYLNGGKTQFEYAFEKFASEDKVVLTLVVYNDYISFYNDYELILFGKPDICERLTRFCTSFASIYDFEKTLPLLKSVKLSDILKRKLSDPALRSNDVALTAEKYEQFSMEQELSTVTHVWSDVFGVIFDNAIDSSDE